MGDPLLGRRYRYDAAGNLAELQDDKHGSVRYQYDKIGRIVQAIQPNLQERFAFDPAHNLLDPQAGNAKSAGLIKDNRLQVFEDKRYAYDTHGNLIEKKIGKHTRMHLVWDVEHRLQRVRLTTAAHTGQPKTRTTHYRYDAFGRRLQKRVCAENTNNNSKNCVFQAIVDSIPR